MPATNQGPASTLYGSLVAAQRAMGPVVKSSTNPAFKTKYADLESVLDAVRGPLGDNGLVLIQPLTMDGDRLMLGTVVVHAETGDKIESLVEVRCADRDNPQKIGGAITYYRRYSILALLGLAPSEDDDGASASQPARSQSRPAAPGPNGNGGARITEPHRRRIEAIAKQRGLTHDDWKAVAVGWFKVQTTNDLTPAQATDLEKWLTSATDDAIGAGMEKIGRARTAEPNLTPPTPDETQEFLDNLDPDDVPQDAGRWTR